VFGIANGVTVIGLGSVADRLRTRTLLIGTSSLLAAGAAILLVPSGALAFPGFAVLGLAGGFFGITSGIAWARTYGLSAIGTLQGLSFSVQIVAAAIGPLPPALSLGLTGSYAPGLAVVLGVALVALGVALRWRDPRA
jgi:hypothetical protein